MMDRSFPHPDYRHGVGKRLHLFLKKGSMHNIVTSGVGVFGPNMRVGTKSEICMIDIQFLS